MLRKMVLSLLLLSGSTLLWGQKAKPSAPSPAPHATPAAPHAGAAAPHTAPAASHAGTTAPHTGPTTQHAGAVAPHTTPTAPHAGANTPRTSPTAPHTAPTTPRVASTPHTPPGKSVTLKGGGTASVRPNGQLRSIDRGGMHIEHPLQGGRKIVSTHNGAQVVTTGAHGGYVQRPYVSRNGNTYVQRTYVVNNVSYTNVYRSYNYGGYPYYGYSPPYYYNPGYYGWAANPWPAPVAYGWGWGGAPWYGAYGGYYAPYPVYPSAAFWLTDFVIAASLQAAYAAHAEAATTGFLDSSPEFLVASLAPMVPAADTAAPMSAEVKQALADEVKAELAAEKAAAAKGSASTAPGAASNQAPPALDPAWKVFVVSTALDETADSVECALTPGDVITRTSESPDADRKVTVKVMSSKKTDCAVGKEVLVGVEDLQEMHNYFREQMDGGMKSLSEKQGTGGLPKAPDTSTVPGEVPAPPADTTAAKALQDQQSAADQAEAQTKQEVASSQ